MLPNKSTITVAELKNAIENMPDNMPVVVFSYDSIEGEIDNVAAQPINIIGAPSGWKFGEGDQEVVGLEIINENYITGRGRI